jgi:hypothetical protein
VFIDVGWFSDLKEGKKMFRSITFSVVGATLVILSLTQSVRLALAAPETGPCGIVLIGYNTDP